MTSKFTILLTYIVLIAFNAKAQFSTVTELTPLPIANNTADKPQSKLWIHAGQHWAVLPDSKGTHVWRLDGKSWTKIVTIYNSTYAKADCKVVGNITHILLYRGTSTSYIASVEYDPMTNTYGLWKTRSSRAAVQLDDGVETATMDIDSKGRMWIASDAVTDIRVRWSDPPYSNWSAPITIASGISSDDLCSIIALPGKVGVFWSDQITKRFGFKTHTDGADPSVWSADEVPASQSALNIRGGMADDHLNLTASGDGTLYCAVKTEYETAGYPKLALLVRRPSGSWDNLYSVTTDIGTRPIVVLNETQRKLKVVYTSAEGGGDILYKESSTSPIAFGSQHMLIRGNYNYPTSIKSVYSPSIVILASTNTEAVGILGSDVNSESPDLVPDVPILLSPQDLTKDVSTSLTLNWNTSLRASVYQVQVSTTTDFSTTAVNEGGIQENIAQVKNLSYGTKYYWRVLASNSVGNSGWSSVWSFTTAPLPASTLVGSWGMNEGGGTTLIDESTFGNNASTMGNPSWVLGVSGQALRLNGSNQYATVQNSPSLNMTNAITVAAWIKPEKKGSAQVIVKKGLTGETDGYELSLVSNGKIFFRINQLTDGENYRVNSSTSHPADGVTWMHIAATFDGSSIRLYVNGQLNKSATFSSPAAIIPNALPLGIGAQSNGGNRYQGALDDVRVYSRALSASEISSLASLSAFSSESLQAVGTDRTELRDEMAIFPNPFSSKAVLNFLIAEGGEYIISLYDSRGAEVQVLKRGVAVAGNYHAVEVEGGGLTNGLYLVKLQANGRYLTTRLILNK